MRYEFIGFKGDYEFSFDFKKSVSVIDLLKNNSFDRVLVLKVYPHKGGGEDIIFCLRSGRDPVSKFMKEGGYFD